MIKDPSDTSKVKLNVWHNNGETFFGKDTTSRPFGEAGDLVVFWAGEALVVYPMREVKKIEMYFEE